MSQNYDVVMGKFPQPLTLGLFIYILDHNIMYQWSVTLTGVETVVDWGYVLLWAHEAYALTRVAGGVSYRKREDMRTGNWVAVPVSIQYVK